MKRKTLFSLSVTFTLTFTLSIVWDLPRAFATPASGSDGGAGTVVASANTPNAANPSANRLSIKLSPGGPGSQTFSLAMPSGTQAGTLTAVLNGKDVSSKFSASDCSGKGEVCATGTLSSSDG